MIARRWRGWAASQAAADAYAAHFDRDVRPRLVETPGFVDAALERTEHDGGRTEIEVVTRWESLDAIKAFAGEDHERAVVAPEARAVLAEFDERVRHTVLRDAPRIDLGTLPDGLPVPEDDGAAAGIEGMPVPSIRLPSTEAEIDLRERSAGPLVLYVYPRTGIPEGLSEAGWNAIPGARGCTAESCAFRDHVRELRELGASVMGLSAQPLEEQRAFAAAAHIPYPLLNDSGLVLARELGLPTFDAAGATYYKRLTLVAERHTVVKVFYPVFPPDRHADEVLAWLAAEGVT